MLKWKSRIAFAVLCCVGAAALWPVDRVHAADRKLQYPEGYGCKCVPNSKSFGYEKTKWRVWPGEERLDETFPGAVGKQVIPTPPGEKEVPLPRAKTPTVPGETVPTPEGEKISPPSEGLPPEPGTEKPAEPGAMPGLQSTPSESGGFNPLPGLPPDLNTPPPPNPSEKKDDEKPDSTPPPPEEPKSSSIKSQIKLVKPLPPITPPKADWTSALQPGVYGEMGRTGGFMPSGDLARPATYHEPVDTSMAARFDRNIQSQSFYEPIDSSEVGAATPSDVQSVVPTPALNGFCPVELCRNGRWIKGDPRWTVVHGGMVYRLSGNTQRQEFLASPEKFVPANGGCDLVLSAVEHRNVHGDVQYCAAFQGRIYMFQSAGTQEEFQKNPQRYIQSGR